MNRARMNNSSIKYVKLGEEVECCIDGRSEMECETTQVHEARTPEDNSTGRIESDKMTGQKNGDIFSRSELEEEDTALFGIDEIFGSSGQDSVNSNVGQIETLHVMIIQIIIPFLFAGFGIMAAGLLLDAVQHWSVYVHITELFILIPALLGLKGNLEMTLASRLSTAANLGELHNWRNIWKLTWGNMSLLQAQALVVAGLATVFSIILGADLQAFHQLLLGSSAMGAASIASAILGTIMILVIVLSHFLHINPDNVATPIAASLGDLVTLGLLSLLAQGIYNSGRVMKSWPVEVLGVADDGYINSSGSGGLFPTTTHLPITSIFTNTSISPTPILSNCSTVLVLLVLLIPVSIWLAYKNTHTRSVLIYGWVPVISAMLISSGGGWILFKAVQRWKGIAIYSPIINGVGGNLVAVQASRISTSLHQVSSPGNIILNPDYQYHGIHRTFFHGSVHARTACVLVSVALPGSLIFLIVIDVLRAGHTTQSLLFYAGYLLAAMLQMIILLMLADWMVHYIWKLGYDPDNIAIPFLTALGDLLGMGFLSIAFLVLWYLGDRDEDVGE